ncbi:hypothetical protein HBI73_214550 [Parastagonospora nodorum]|nr:hypothetical protein HBH52_189110 [Parastagonospora nodorum]KAH3993922.1 hypothetical protein HBI10_194230 [Parastagonospora nodorum]KAH4008713.1 hypothetical protein HBI13_231740 [Parastagonospora nodorum]KAH4084446.1 hypothetical protein HBH46_212640 [Parastagonospora nodorum]KAH4596337.1 hypothetical protein HBH82_230400 [Parastagonospora nodorum]
MIPGNSPAIGVASLSCFTHEVIEQLSYNFLPFDTAAPSAPSPTTHFLFQRSCATSTHRLSAMNAVCLHGKTALPRSTRKNEEQIAMVDLFPSRTPFPFDECKAMAARLERNLLLLTSMSAVASSNEEEADGSDISGEPGDNRGAGENKTSEVPTSNRDADESFNSEAPADNGGAVGNDSPKESNDNGDASEDEGSEWSDVEATEAGDAMLTLVKPLPWIEQVTTVIHLKQTSSAPNGGHHDTGPDVPSKGLSKDDKEKAAGSSTEFQVASIVSCRVRRRKPQYLMKWPTAHPFG